MKKWRSILQGKKRSLFDQWQATALVGTPEQVSEKVQTYVDLGCSGFIPWCSDYPDTESMDLFASEVMPNFR